jgi:CubicO group peptidase (beta-lactamase class C family)
MTGRHKLGLSARWMMLSFTLSVGLPQFTARAATIAVVDQSAAASVCTAARSLLERKVAVRAAPAAAATAGAPVTQAQPTIDPATLVAFVDGVVRGYMAENGIAGVTVAVTDRHDLLLLRGYGIAGENPARAVDPNSTLFRLGSISKTFTYVAAMQLVAEHKLDLDAPVDRYLPVSLKTDIPGYPPIRIWNLMTHTAGFEDAVVSAHMFYADPRNVPQLDAYLARYRPKRVRPPGVHADYSNYSVELLGAIVERVSGKPFDDYIEQYVLDPLGMRHTTFRELLPKDDSRAVSVALAGDFSTGFEYENGGGFAPRRPEYISNGAPAGAGSSDAADMAIWMRTLLNDGEADGHRVLDPVTFHQMVTPTFRNAPAVHAIAHGFFVGRYGCYASLEHDGDTLWFHSNMVVLPQAGIGVFVSTNTNTGASLAEGLPRLIFQHFLPGSRPASAPPPPPAFARSGQVYAGTYLSERRDFSTIEKALSTTVATVTITPRGYLLVNGGKNGRFVELSPDIFREVDNSDRIQFLRNAHGRVTGLAIANGNAVFDKEGLFENPLTALAALALLMPVCLCALTGAWGRRRRTLPGTAARHRDVCVPAIVLLAAACGWLLFLLLMIAAIVVMSAAGYKLLFHFPPPILLVVVVMGYAASILTLIALWFLPRVWRMQAWSFWRKVRHNLILALMVWVVVMLVEWKVLLAPLVL